MDDFYSNPHEAALAVVATAIKKSRLRFYNLVINAVLAGILFSAGGLLYVGVHSENSDLYEKNPGVLNFVGAATFTIGLFYVVIMGAELYNANVLYFSVGLMRRAVTIYDLAISWVVSLLGNIAGTLFVTYVFVYLSGTGTSEAWKAGSRKLVDLKASFSFIQTFLKGIAGNFFVTLAVYLQLMAKPLHVRLFLMGLPIFTFVALGFTHVVADMSIMYIGMLNGADLSVSKYIWKLLIPAALGNAIGGTFMGLAFPYYSHLFSVEQDRKELSMPEYDARDEQPDLNMDSRVVRVPTAPTNLDDVVQEYYDEDKRANTTSNSDENSLYSVPSEPISDATSHRHIQPVQMNSRTLSRLATRSPKIARSPAGVFPILGMGEPLAREKTIENPYHTSAIERGSPPTTVTRRRRRHNSLTALERPRTCNVGTLQQVKTISHLPSLRSRYNVLEDRPGSKLERVVSKAAEKVLPSMGQEDGLPRANQDTFPHNEIHSVQTYT